MSIGETEAKRICRQAGMYCEQKTLGSTQYNISISDNGVQGEFEIVDGNEVRVSYAMVDPFTGRTISKDSKVFDEPHEWSAFCHELSNLVLPKEESNDSDFDPAMDSECNTEAERVEHVRVGQSLYRKRLEKLWDGACAVTGVSRPELLRASHAKPWAECDTGSERLNPYNGLLLNVALDALFDKFLISFDDEGRILISPELNQQELALVGIHPDLRMRKIEPQHKPFLEWHRERFNALSQGQMFTMVTNYLALLSVKCTQWHFGVSLQPYDSKEMHCLSQLMGIAHDKK